MPMRRAPAARASSPPTRRSAPPPPPPRPPARPPRTPERAAHPRPARARAHAETAELRRPARLDQHPAGADDRAGLVDGDEMERLGIQAVASGLGRDALLAAEDLVAQRDGGGELVLVAGPADLGGHWRR